MTRRLGGLRAEEGKAHRSHRNPRTGAAAETPPQSYGQCVTPGCGFGGQQFAPSSGLPRSPSQLPC